MYKSEHIITSRHYLILVSVAFLLGIFLSLSFGVGFSFGVAAVALVLGSILGLVFVLSKTTSLKKKHILLPLVLIIFFLLGVLRVFFIDISHGNSLRKYAGEELWLYGTVVSDPQVTKSGYYHTFELDVFKAGDDETVQDTVIVFLPETHRCSLKPGDDVFFWAKLSDHPEGENVHSYEYYNFLRGKNIFLTANTKNINMLSGYKHFSLISYIKQSGSFIRSKISAAADRLFPKDPEASAVLKGILIGDKSDFSDELYDKFSNSGISHIVSVSGLHVSILFSFLMVIFGLSGISRKVLMLFCIPFMLVFMSASAFSPSTLRASFMVLLMICAFLLSEEYHSLTSLFLAISIIVAVAPYSIFSKSLVLSFSATFGIFVYFPYLYRALNFPLFMHKSNKGIRVIRKPISYLASSLAISASSLLGTAYFLVVFFGKISKVQFLTNLWVIPLVSFIFCLGYITCAFVYLVPTISLSILKYPLGLCLGIIKYTVNIFGESRFAYIFPFKISALGYAAVYFGIAFVIYMILKTISDIYNEKNQKPQK